MNKKSISKYSKYANEAILLVGTITEIEIQNQILKEKYKTVFYCKNDTTTKENKCIIWGLSTFEVGDRINAKGRIKDGIFLVWSYKYRSMKRKSKENNEI